MQVVLTLEAGSIDLGHGHHVQYLTLRGQSCTTPCQNIGPIVLDLRTYDGKTSFLSNLIDILYNTGLKGKVSLVFIFH
jgi:hypothetical protein